MVIPSIVILLITAITMILALEFKNGELYKFVVIKEIIWTIMSIIFVVIYVKREKAQNAFNNGDFLTAKNQLNPLAKYLIPTNIILGLLALVLGIRLRGL
jgi:SNF family Na+-dependent transporter